MSTEYTFYGLVASYSLISGIQGDTTCGLTFVGKSYQKGNEAPVALPAGQEKWINLILRGDSIKALHARGYEPIQRSLDKAIARQQLSEARVAQLRAMNFSERGTKNVPIGMKFGGNLAPASVLDNLAGRQAIQTYQPIGNYSLIIQKPETVQSLSLESLGGTNMTQGYTEGTGNRFTSWLSAATGFKMAGRAKNTAAAGQGTVNIEDFLAQAEVVGGTTTDAANLATSIAAAGAAQPAGVLSL